MRAAVYRGKQKVEIEEIPVPSIGPGEILIEVEACGICHTDLKKIEYGLLEPPRIFGHETAGRVAAIGEGVTKFAVGDKVIAFHHIPCSKCFYCERKLYAQCAGYKTVGITAGYEAAGGGYAQYARVMPWIVERGVEKIPDGVSFEQASFVEPVNTCHKGIEQSGVRKGDLALVLGQGPIGLIFTMLLKHRGIDTITTDTMPTRRAKSLHFGALQALDPLQEDLPAAAKAATEGRGADVVFVAASAPGIVEQAIRATRPGATIVLFAQTSEKERIDISGADICKDERVLMGAYSADVDLQAESARLVFSGEIPVAELVTHTFPLPQIIKGVQLATHPDAESLKIVIQPQRV
ncbi:alcohol dehydrogenase catalytic domain-containing protein [Bryobacter aggregatus]|uniref:alcohol dehydrogenase catalytic domain-containing protein n=1 Tax=Bryobacter aggregatus TaxID=360054 RepID=UPI00068A6DC3|nr:Zn-dependent alcohol dehydrogenase [Bryobacter aggregatus]